MEDQFTKDSEEPKMNSERIKINAEIAHEGFLTKWTNYLYGWQKRYVKIGSGTLQYSIENQGIFHFQGLISLRKSTVKVHPKDELRFDLFIGPACYYFRASTIEERMLWVNKIISERDNAINLNSPNLGTPNPSGHFSHNSFSSISSLGSLNSHSLNPVKSINNLNDFLPEINSLKNSISVQMDELQSFYTYLIDFIKINSDKFSKLNDGLLNPKNEKTQGYTKSSESRNSSDYSPRLVRSSNSSPKIDPDRKHRKSQSFGLQEDHNSILDEDVNLKQNSDSVKNKEILQLSGNRQSSGLSDVNLSSRITPIYKGMPGVTNIEIPRESAPETKINKNNGQGISNTEILNDMSVGAFSESKYGQNLDNNLDINPKSFSTKEIVFNGLNYKSTQGATQYENSDDFVTPGGSNNDFSHDKFSGKFGDNSDNPSTKTHEYGSDLNVNKDNSSLNKKQIFIAPGYVVRRPLGHRSTKSSSLLASSAPATENNAFGYLNNQRIKLEASSLKFKNTINGLVSGITSCIEQIENVDRSFKEELEKERESNQKLHNKIQELNKQLIQKNAANGPDAMSCALDEVFYDALFNELAIEEDIEALEEESKEENIEPTVQNPYQTKVDDFERESLSFLTSLPDDESWTLVYNDPPTILFKKELLVDDIVLDPYRVIHLYQGVTAKELSNFFWDVKHRLKIDSHVDHVFVKAVYGDNIVVVHHLHKTIWPAARRDSLIISKRREINDPAMKAALHGIFIKEFKISEKFKCVGDSWMVSNVSIDYPDVSVHNYVRVDAKVGFLAQSFIKENANAAKRDNYFTLLNYSASINPGGWLPHSAVRTMARREFPKFLKNLGSVAYSNSSSLPVDI